MLRRITTAAIFLVVVFAGFTWPSMEWLLVGVTAIIAVMCTFELCDMMRKKGLRVYRRVASWGVLALLLEAEISRLDNAILVFGLAACFAWLVRLPGKVEGSWGDISATVFTLAYVGIPLGAIITVFRAGDVGQAWLIFSLAVIWTTDSVALFTGRAFGKTKLAPRISPGKSVEGSIGGVLGGVVVGIIVALFFADSFPGTIFIEYIAFAILFSVVGQVGDLAESLLKRDVGVKDSGSELTGHGGFLDLMDAVLFAAVPLVIYLRLLHPEVFLLPEGTP